MTPQELAELDLAVAKAEGLIAFIIDYGTECGGRIACEAGLNIGHMRVYQPTRDAQEAGRLLVKYNLSLIAPIPGGKYWYANWGLAHEAAGETPWIAACNAVVALGGRK